MYVYFCFLHKFWIYNTIIVGRVLFIKPEMLASFMGIDCSLAAALVVPLPANVPWRAAEDGPRRVPTTPMKEQDGVPSC